MTGAWILAQLADLLAPETCSSNPAIYSFYNVSTAKENKEKEAGKKFSRARQTDVIKYSFKCDGIDGDGLEVSDLCFCN